MNRKLTLAALLLAFFLPIYGVAQKLPSTKYPSLLWEITGNGLKKPSYLFGTMHVSSKLAFHLSDSFYYAIRKVDAVALELNPELWQGQMVDMNKLNEAYTGYVMPSGSEYVNEKTFRIQPYEDMLKLGMRTEPPVVNSLLYRSYKAREDFEEDTFLDLYIYQTGRKLGKAPAGVEDYYESEKLVLEAYADMAKEKKKKEIDLDGETMSGMVEKMQQAYRRGDLDLMDSIDIMLEKSPAFREKFLYKRNEIQADAIDSIMRSRSLFVGVGAAHLPGDRGVIELLRKKGYTLRPVNMHDRDALQRDQVDKLHVPVVFQTQYAADSIYRVDVPGPLYSINNQSELSRWQYADMNNGSYYMVTRVKTYAGFFGSGPQEVLRKTDSLLYENIPGRIVTKKNIIVDGYPAIELTNRTRRGDLQRYRMVATPYEVIIFKMSGKDEYANGPEADRFFSSIKMQPGNTHTRPFIPAQGGFAINMPAAVHQFYNAQLERWEYESTDPESGDAYLIMKRSTHNDAFIEADSFDLALAAESFHNTELFEDNPVSYAGTLLGREALFVKEKLKKGGKEVLATFILHGPGTYIIAKRPADAKDTSFNFAKGFSFTPYRYAMPVNYSDTFLRITMQTPVHPVMDGDIRRIIEQASADAANGNNSNGYFQYWKKARNAVLHNDSTGEVVAVQVQEYPKYFYIRDSAAFWKKEISDYLYSNDLVLREQRPVILSPGLTAQYFSVQDTGSSRMIERLIFLYNTNMYTLSSVGDTAANGNNLWNIISTSVRPQGINEVKKLYDNKVPLFFDDLFSKDSTTHHRAQQSISNVYFGPASAHLLYDGIRRVSYNDPDYFDTKAKLIAELGYIKDSTDEKRIPAYLKEIYAQTADTSLFQNEVVEALARIKTKSSYIVLKEILLQDPPVFDNNESNTIFGDMQDTLKLSAMMFPELLQLLALEDYKGPVTDLLVELVDSGLVKGKLYENYYNAILVDARVAQKKQQARDESQMKEDKERADEKKDDDEPVTENRYNSNRNVLRDYAALLMPFYNEKVPVQQFFNRLLKSTDPYIRMDAAVRLLKHGISVPDTLFTSLAKQDKYLGTLYSLLEEAKMTDRIPANLRTQAGLARSLLAMESDVLKMDSIELIGSTVATLYNHTGRMYFFKYRIKRSSDWKIGISGMQPLDPAKVDVDYAVVSLTEKKLKLQDPIQPQLDAQLKKLLYSYHKSAKYFYGAEEGDYRFSGDGDN